MVGIKITFRKMRKYSILIILLLCCNTIFSQTLTGKIINADSKEPLASASVYLSNTSIGINTNKQGIFNLSVAGGGKYKLVVSYIGYETFTKLINFSHLPDDLIIPLKPKLNKLDDVVLEPYETNGWEKWGRFFTDLFIGTASYTWDCVIKNPEIIKFRNSKKDNKLYAYAFEPLIIKNNSLGYDIKYSLEEFEFDFSTKVVTFNGYPLFKDMAIDHPSKARRWEDKRKNVYYGSLMHFMRAFFVNRLEEEGFEMRSLAYVPNLAKFRAIELYKQHIDSIIVKNSDTVYHRLNFNSLPTAFTYNKSDSTDYYKKAVVLPDTIISHILISADSIGFAIDSSTAGLYCKDSLEVNYLLKEVPNEYKRLTAKHKHEKFPVSQFTFINHKPIEISRNGNYFGPHDLKITGYWAWWETISTMLPFDYWPPKKE